MRLLLSAFINPAPTPAAPTVTADPAIVGSPVVGVTLNFGNGDATGTPTPGVTNFRWQSAPTGTSTWTTVGTAHTYLLAAGDLNNDFQLLLDWVNSAGTATGTSARIGPVTNPGSPPGPVSPPVISG